MQKFDLKQTIRRVRQNWWFEKYIWFISSETLGEANGLLMHFHWAGCCHSLFLKPGLVARCRGIVNFESSHHPSVVKYLIFQWAAQGPASCLAFRNYLVISGHDAIQTEQLFLKHVGPNDAFVQADVAGARTCFVRNPSGGNDTVCECFL